MRIGIYHELREGDAAGGAERCVAILAEALQHSHDVEIVNHCPALGVEALARFAGTNLERVRLRHVPSSRDPQSFSPRPWRRYRWAKQWHASLSEGYDLFINLAHGLPSFCHAKHGVLFVLFPFFRPLHLDSDVSGYVRAYDRWEWRRRIESYDVTLASSRFTQTWTRRLWNLESHVLYPPADMACRRETKDDIILSVGRFSTQWHQKKQREIVTAFGDLEGDLPTWEFRCVGALSELPPDHTFLADVQTLAAGYRVRVLVNLPRTDLETMYARAKIFWHAAGYGEDDEVHPDRLEHFGMATVEAMSAGCVPVVIDKGGQREIVEHGISGFRWRTLEELKEYTRLLAREARVQAQMSEAARDRASHFSRARFLTQFRSLMQPLIG
jgi:glycosyltransferase involved in cell wall biosynthesis